MARQRQSCSTAPRAGATARRPKVTKDMVMRIRMMMRCEAYHHHHQLSHSRPSTFCARPLFCLPARLAPLRPLPRSPTKVVDSSPSILDSLFLRSKKVIVSGIATSIIQSSIIAHHDYLCPLTRSQRPATPSRCHLYSENVPRPPVQVGPWLERRMVIHYALI